MELDSFEFDDAFMFMRYAENLLAGNGFSWNAEDGAIFGCTSILYVYIVAVVKFLFGGLANNSILLTATSFFFALAFLMELNGGMFQSVRSSFMKSRWIISFLTIPFLALPLVFGFHASTGIETTLSLFLHTGFIYTIIRYGRSGHNEKLWWILAALTTYLIYLVRPDNAIVAALFPLFYLLAR